MIYFYSNRSKNNFSLNAMYRSVNETKQGFHQYLHRRNRQNEEIRHLIGIILQVRRDHPTMCCRSMYYKIRPSFVGRDKFEVICRVYGFTTQRKKARHKTTDSSGVVRFDNLMKDRKLSSINEVWSSDITYFELKDTFYYITFIIDCYSRRILGYSVSSRLLTEHTTLPAMKKALKQRGDTMKPGIIFHSDGGGQYYDRAFLNLTRQNRFRNSMCKHAYENGIAERLNGVIKNNYLKHWAINSLDDLVKSVDRAVYLYNHDKPHISLHRKTPVEFEKELLNLPSQSINLAQLSGG